VSLRKGSLRKGFVLGAAAWIVALAAVGCGGSSPSGSAKPAPQPPAQSASQPASQPGASGGAAASGEPVKVTLRLPWIASGYDAPFVVAKARGFYRKAGFDVTVAEGKGSAITGQTVGNGSDTFGVDDAGTAALLIAKGVPIRVVSVYIQKSPIAFIYDRSHPFSSPKDLLGRLVVTSAGNAALTVLPAVLATAGLRPSQVKITTIQPQSFATELKTHPDAVVLGVSLSDYLVMHKVDPNAAYKLYADFGPNVYGFGLITNLSEIQRHPGAVGRFVAATAQGWAYAQQHPDEAVKDLVAAFPHVDPALGRQGLDMAVGLLHTPATKGHPLGWMATSDWQQSIGILAKYGGLKSSKPVADYFTNSFIPQG
jgi:NitT/TauT family transport system substrate-binding protein